MLAGFYKIVEERIRQAQRKGEFDNLSGHGEPLNLEDDSGFAGDLRLAHKILKNSDCLPPELELKKEIRQTEDLLAAMEGTAEKYRLLKKLNFLVMKLNMNRDSAIEFEEPQRYSNQLIEKLGSKNPPGQKISQRE